MWRDLNDRMGLFLFGIFLGTYINGRCWPVVLQEKDGWNIWVMSNYQDKCGEARLWKDSLRSS